SIVRGDAEWDVSDTDQQGPFASGYRAGDIAKAGRQRVDVDVVFPILAPPSDTLWRPEANVEFGRPRVRRELEVDVDSLHVRCNCEPALENLSDMLPVNIRFTNGLRGGW